MNGLELERSNASFSGNANDDDHLSSSFVRLSDEKNDNNAPVQQPLPLPLPLTQQSEPQPQQIDPHSRQSQSLQTSLPASQVGGYQPPSYPLETLPQQQQQQQQQHISHDNKPEPPVVVETVHSRDSDQDEEEPRAIGAAPAPVRLVLVCMPKTQKQAIQLGMTLLFCCILVAALFSFAAVHQYRLVIALVWLWLLFLFVLFAYFVQHGVGQRTRGGVFHPVLHAAADFLSNEVQAFRQDWREQVLLLTYDEEYAKEEFAGQSQEGQDELAEATPYEELRNNVNNNNGHQKRWRRNKKLQNPDSVEHKQPKSRIFRTFVKPLLPMIRRKKKKRSEKEQELPPVV